MTALISELKSTVSSAEIEAAVSLESLCLRKNQIRSSSCATPIDIILLTFNRREYFEKTITALVSNTRYPYRLIVVDNDSSPAMREYLKNTAELYDHLILNDDNYYTTSFQRGIACALSDPYIVSDPDILVPALEGPCWLERLVTLHQTYPEMGLIALNLDPANKPAKLPDVYIGDKTSYGKEITLSNVGTVMQCIKRRYFDGRYITDWETCEQIRQNGGKVGFANHIVAWHLGWDEDRDYPDYLLEKHEYFRKKYNAETYRMYTEKEELLSRMAPSAPPLPGYYTCTRPEIQQLVKPTARRILDVGCAAGMLGYELKQKLGAEVWGVEYVPAAAEQAAGRLDRVLQGAIEAMLPLLPDRYFDTIIMADVLEHLVEPGEVLQAMQTKLAPDGEIVASIPNVRHWSIVRRLLEGRWEYVDAGILDRTHLRFFTWHDCILLFEKAGYRLFHGEATMLDNFAGIPDSVVTALADSGLNVSTLTEESLHYQFLVKATPIARQIALQEATPVDGSQNTDRNKEPDSSELTSIIILTWNQLSFTQACLESIAQHTPEPYQLIIVDNGSSDGTVPWLRERAKTDRRISVIENSSNLGFSAGCNQGIRASRGQYLLLLNNDTIVTPGWLSGMRTVLDRFPDAGIIGPMTNSASGVQVVPDVSYSSPGALPEWTETFCNTHRYRIIAQRRIVGFCMLFKRELVDAIGLLDESFGSGNYEDDDFCLRAELAGFRNLIAGDVFIHHEGGATFAGNNLIRGNENRKNRVKFKQKWDPARLEESVLRRWLVLNAIEESGRLAQQGNVQGAVDTLLNRGIGIDQNSPVPYFKLIEILIDAERYDDALQVLPEMPEGTDRSIMDELEAVCRCALGENAAAEEAARKALKGSHILPRAVVVLGTIAARQGDLAEARTLFNKAIQQAPSCESGWLSLGMLLWGSHDQEGAWQALSHAVMVNPLQQKTVRIYRDLAERSGRFDEAAAVICEASLIWPDSRMLSLAHVEMLAERGCTQEALEVCEKLLVKFNIDDDILNLTLELRKRAGANNRSASASRQSVSACMIVKDEEKHLARCLASLKPVVDEMVVVDTGSSDHTADIAEAFGARIFKFPWNGDFSAARNYSLAKAKGDWILIMDADEVLSERDYPVIRKTLSAPADERVAWSVTTRNYTYRAESEGWQANDGSYPEQEQGDGWYPSRKVRLFPAAAKAKFRGDIHEMVEGFLRDSGFPIEQAGFVVHHYGELSEEDRRAKQWRYYELGKQKLAEQPDDPMALTELALQAGELGMFDEALKLWDRLLAAGLTSRDIYFNRSYVLMGMNRFSEASDMARKALEIDPDHKESAYNYGMCMLNLSRPELALETVADESSKHPDYPLLLALLCVLYLSMGEHVSATKLFGALKESNYAIAGYVQARVTVLDQLGQRALADRIREAAAGLGI